MKNYRLYILFSLATLLTSCEKAIMTADTSSTAVNVFEYLWHKVDEQYAMFDVKDVDWGAVYDSLRPQVRNGMSSDSLFTVCSKMLSTLNDGHVNLYSSYDVARADSLHREFYTESSIDINTIVLNYIGTNYHMAGGLAYNGLCDNKVIYIYYSSFSNSFSPSQLRHIIGNYPEAKGMVIDIRGNGGGNIQNVYRWLQMVPSQRPVIFRSQIKSGPGHDDLTPLADTYGPLNTDTSAFSLPVLVLIDRGCYSAASIFAISTMAYPQITLVGDTTGGGLGLPSSGVLPNGWQYRFPVTRAIAIDGRNYENGVPPDIPIKFDRQQAYTLGRDNILDSACSIILNQ